MVTTYTKNCSAERLTLGFQMDKPKNLKANAVDKIRK